MFDTSPAFNNEWALGQAINQSGISREEFKVSIKVPDFSCGYQNTKKQIDDSLQDLDLKYIDMLVMEYEKIEQLADDDIQNQQMRAESW